MCIRDRWCVLHFLSIDGPQFRFTLLKGLEVDNLPIVLTYHFNGALYVAILVKGMKGTKLSFVQRFVFPSLALIGAGSVSYTHLDVYKRQPQNSCKYPGTQHQNHGVDKFFPNDIQHWTAIDRRDAKITLNHSCLLYTSIFYFLSKL